VTPVSNALTITTLFGPRKPARATPGDDPTPESAPKNFCRMMGRALLCFSMLFFLLSGYLAFAHYWILTQWMKSEATVLSSELRQRSSGSTSRSGSVAASSKVFFFHCLVSYPVGGETRQSMLDSPGSTDRIDTEVWAARMSRGQRVAIFYKPSDPSRIRLEDNPAEATASGSLRVAFYLLIPGLILILISRPNRLDS
jgi:hypothetical protein